MIRPWAWEGHQPWFFGSRRHAGDHIMSMCSLVVMGCMRYGFWSGRSSHFRSVTGTPRTFSGCSSSCNISSFWNWYAIVWEVVNFVLVGCEKVCAKIRLPRDTLKPSPLGKSKINFKDPAQRPGTDISSSLSKSILGFALPFPTWIWRSLPSFGAFVRWSLYLKGSLFMAKQQTSLHLVPKKFSMGTKPIHNETWYRRLVGWKNN